jgi:hypothetical protein
MARESLLVPEFIEDRDKSLLIKKLLVVNSANGGCCKIISINYDVYEKTWVLWYYPIKSRGGGVL